MLYWVTGAVLLVYLLLVWFFAGWINPPGAGIWVLRVGLWLIGILGAGFTIWWFRRQAKADGADNSALTPGATTEVDLLVRDAVRKLKNSAMGRGGSLRNLPLIFVVGDPASAKTTTIIHSALDPELLSGHVYQDNTVVPTRVANFWYTRQAVFVDGGGGLYSQPDLWRRLIRLVQPGRVAAAGKQQQAPRAAIVCFDCEILRPGSQEAVLSAARRLGTRLLEISQLLGISFPIYVLFTKADRIGARADGGSAFLDYVAGLNKDETSQVLGATLPVRSLQATGVYADEETKRLEKAFDELFYSLAEKRVDFLSVAGQAEKLAGIYEFPRELRKLRQYAVPFLVELARPSQLSVNPFLRGFYFAGVRPVVIEGAVSSIPEPQPDPGFNANATVVFGAGGMRAAQPVAPRVSGARKVPEWVFLSQLFNEVLLKDRVALSASGFSSRVGFLRRIALAAVIGIALIFAIGFLTSFIGNFFLERTVKQAVDDVRAIRATPGQTPSLDQLQKLDGLRKELEPLSAYGREGAPWRLRWWMYSGDYFYSSARQVYFDQFSNLLFAETQAKLLTSLRNVKDKPDPSDSYEATYNPLKAYLITTSNPEKSSQDFLQPILYSTWATGKNPDDQTSALVPDQFSFYSRELPFSNPYPSRADSRAVGGARAYLGGFNEVDRNYYRLMNRAHTADNRDVNFPSVFPTGASVISSHDTVRAAFTHDGFALVQAALNAPANQASEDWVVGKDTAALLDPASLHQALKQRYHDEYVQAWKNVLSHAVVVISSREPKEAAKTLDTLTSTNSPLLEFLWFISHNTHVADQDISAVFGPVQAVEPPDPERGFPSQYKVGANAAYTDALSNLRGALTILASSAPTPGDTHLSDAAREAVEKAKIAADTVAGNDAKYGISDALARLLKQPIAAAEMSIGRAPIQGVNGAGKTFCDQVDQLKRSFPFNPSAPDLSIDVLNATLAPTNDSGLQVLIGKLSPQFLTKAGSTYTANDASSIKISKDFITSLRQIMALRDVLYSNGSPTPKVEYSLKQVASNVDGLALKIGPSELSGTGQQKPFTWTGSNEEVRATQKDVEIGLARTGPWAIFHFIYDGHPASRGPATYALDFVKQSNGQDIIVGGKRQTYSYELHFTNGNPWAEFSGLRCVSQVTQR